MEPNSPARTLSPVERTTGQVLERRKKERRPARGQVVLFLEEPQRLEIRGSLVDVSEDGFRVAHHHAALFAGQQVAFRHPFAEGVARVMWHRVTEDRSESGFLVLEKTIL